jgi:2-oxoglutarate dehydrogenase E2 component (dihydrolipoamide succinyltransferase)
MGESIFEGTITKWLKKAGETVQKDEPLFEISTDKVDAEIPSPVTGILSEIRFAEGSTVQVNTIVAVVADGGSLAAVAPAALKPEKQAEKPAEATAPAPLKSTPPPTPALAPTPAGTEVVMPQMGESIFEGTITKWLKKVGDTVQKDELLFEISTDKVDAEIPSPVAGILAEIRAAEGTTVQVNGVVAVIGSSVGEGVTEAPVKTRTEAATAQPVAVPVPRQAPTIVQQPGLRLRSSPLVRRIAKEHNIELAQVPGTGSDGRITKDDILRFLAHPAAKVPAPATQALKGEVVPLSRMRAIIAQRMVDSKRISPHVHSVYKVDMTRIVRLREREKASFEQRTGVKLTYMPFIAIAAIEALRRYPIVNASLIDNAIHYHANINLGIAVALEWGLIVPAVREAEKRSFADLARTINDLAGRARTKKLSPDEVGGSTFTLTNSGVFGDEFGTPIINQPESAILAIGALRKEPVVLTDAEGNDTIAIRSMQHFCLGFDHRLIDGADGGKFMSEFKKTLETWDRGIA